MIAAGFWTAPTLATLTGGGIGSLIAVAGAFFIARWTVRSDRRRDAEERAREAERQDQADRQAVAAALSRVTAALELESRGAPFLAGRTQRVLLDAVIEGHRLVYRSHPMVAEWLLLQQSALSSMPGWNLQALASTKFNRNFKAYATSLAEVLAAVQAWAIGQRDDQWFADEVAQRENDRHPDPREAR